MFIIFNYILLNLNILLNHILLGGFSYYNGNMNFDFKSPAAVLGYGVEGKYAVEFLRDQGISDITVFDEKESVEVPEGLKAKLGAGVFTDITGFNTIIRSPGVHYKLPGITEARDAGAFVTSMTDLTLELARKRLTAITGSNGKTTTVGMTEAVLRAHYDDKIIVGGNDRQPVLSEVMKNSSDPILLEVSSFQFADLHKSPHISAILNITPNHMDWHENLEDYVHAKNNLLAHQSSDDWAVLNSENEDTVKLAEEASGQLFWLNKKEGRNWAVWEDDKLVACFDGELMDVLEKDDLTVKTHPDNVLCATAVSLIHGASPVTIKKALMEFKGVENRLEFVREIDGIKFYNDSACTTPESSKVAIDAFPEGSLILLLGGSSKNADFSFLAHDIVESGTRVVLYGAEGPVIKAALDVEIAESGKGSELILSLEVTRDFEKIITQAKIFANPGDNVALSPACASFDMFKNAKDRGRQFKEIVSRI